MSRWIRLPLALLTAPLLEYRPQEHAPTEVFCGNNGPKLRPGQITRVVSWNIQFCGSREEAFFYDNGPAVHVAPDLVQKTITGILAALQALQPDLLALQEVDRDSERTGRVDQLRRMLAYRPDLSWTSAPYFRAPYVPAPFRDPLGRMDMHLAWMTAPQLLQGHRQQLALLDEPRWRQRFNLKRALLSAKIPLVDGRHLAIANTHLSAFSFGDGTLNKQVDALEAWMRSHPPDQPWILVGDFNLLPPGDDPERLNLDRNLYGGDNPMNRLIPTFKTAFTDLTAPSARTYLPHQAQEPERKIDYVFYGGPVTVHDARVAREHRMLSDHLPLVVELSVQP
ncbi:MAG: endonuclease/exonuclease/phosphatase family protein [Myxococcota bacterium]